LKDFGDAFEDYEEYLEKKGFELEMDTLKADYFADFAVSIY
jgi:hypothetical protein